MKAALLVLALYGCATPPPARFLSQDEDDAMRAQCEAVPCAVVPMPWLQKLLQMLEQRTI